MAWSPTCLGCSFTQFKTPCDLHRDERVERPVCGGCLVGMPRGTGLHTFGDGCRFQADMAAAVDKK